MYEPDLEYLERFGPTFDQLKEVRWTKKGRYRGNFNYPETLERKIDDPVKTYIMKLGKTEFILENGYWNVIVNEDGVKHSTNPIIEKNTVYKQRIQALIRTAAISEIEIHELKEKIKEANEILTQLANSV